MSSLSAAVTAAATALFDAAAGKSVDAEAPEGYDLACFEDEVPADLQCPICHSVVCEPRGCAEGHLFCAACIEKWLRSGNSTCPMDRAPLSQARLSKNLYAARVVEKLRVRCVYNYGSGSAEQQAAIAELEAAVLAVVDAKNTVKLKEGIFSEALTEYIHGQAMAVATSDLERAFYQERVPQYRELRDAARQDLDVHKAKLAEVAKAVAVASAKLQACREASRETPVKRKALASLPVNGKRKASSSCDEESGEGCGWVGPLEEREHHLKHECKAAQAAARRAAARAMDCYGRTMLWKAANESDLASCKRLVEDGADVNRPPFREDVELDGTGDMIIGTTPLFRSVLRGNLNIAKLLVEHGAVVDKREEQEDGDELYPTPLLKAVLENHSEMVAYLLSKGADASLGSEDYTSSFGAAMFNGLDDLLKMLIDHQGPAAAAAINDHCLLPNIILEKVEQGCEAAELEKCDLPRFMIEKGADINLVYGTDTPLTMAICNEWDSLVALLISKGANVEATCPGQQVVLYAASRAGNESLVTKLVSMGVKIDAVGAPDEQVPMHGAALSGSLPIMSMLEKAGAALEVPDKFGLTPFGIACKKGHLKMVKKLLLAGAQINAVAQPCLPQIFDDETGMPRRDMQDYASTALGMACQGGHVEVVYVLLNAGTNNAAAALNPRVVQTPRSPGPGVLDLAKVDGYGRSALYISAEYGQAQCAFLLAAQIYREPNDQPAGLRFGTPPLSRLLKAESCKPFMKKEYKPELGKFVDASEKRGCNALYVACLGGHHDVVKLLINMLGSDPNDGGSKRVPLIAASSGGFEQVIGVLAKHLDTDLDRVDVEAVADPTKPLCALDAALLRKKFDAARHLCDLGAKVDLKLPGNQETLLLRECGKETDKRRTDTVEFLLSQGADPNISGTDGHAALHKILLNRDKSAVEWAALLLAGGANADLPDSRSDLRPLHFAYATDTYATDTWLVAASLLIIKGA